MDRRTFLQWVGVGGLASFLPVAIAACTPSATSSDEVASTTPGSAVIGTVADLDANGFLLNETVAEGVLVVRDPGNPAVLIAVNPVCPHAGCNVDWQADSTLFVCPCHDSRFALDGSVQQGPATSGLAGYTVTIRGDEVILVG